MPCSHVKSSDRPGSGSVSRFRTDASRASSRWSAPSSAWPLRLNFDAPDGKPVNLVFVLLVPEVATEQHLQLLSDLAQMFSERAVREKLAAAPDAAAIRATFAAWQAD
jgi:hypothetical protein